MRKCLQLGRDMPGKCGKDGRAWIGTGCLCSLCKNKHFPKKTLAWTVMNVLTPYFLGCLVVGFFVGCVVVLFFLGWLGFVVGFCLGLFVCFLMHNGIALPKKYCSPIRVSVVKREDKVPLGKILWDSLFRPSLQIAVWLWREISHPDELLSLVFMPYMCDNSFELSRLLGFFCLGNWQQA